MDPNEVVDQLTTVFSGLPNTSLTPEQLEEVRERLAGGAVGQFLTASGATEPAPASTGAVARMARNQGKPTPSPEAPARTRTALVAAGGREIETSLDLGREMADQLGRMDRRDAPKGKVLVASARFSYPPERQLGRDAWENDQKINAVVGPGAPRYHKYTGALVATGGICAPVNVDYGMIVLATADRPIKDGLASFEASRGGVRFVAPPDISQWSGATGIWTEATDASPGSETKPVVAMTCGSEELVYVEAVSTRLGFGNMQGRFAPEQVAANTVAATAEAARIAENNLLAKIAAVAVKDITTAKILGATRDLLSALDLALAQYRNLHRLPKTQSITVIFPEWLKDMIRADLTRETAHQQGNDWNSLMVSDAQIDDLFSVRGVNPIWHLDGQAELSGKYPNQYFGTPTKEAAINAWPLKMAWYMFAENFIQFLDGGRLDLGVVRDSTLDATNDYEVFWETFEGIADRGPTNSVLQYVSTICPSGASSGTVTAECP